MSEESLVLHKPEKTSLLIDDLLDFIDAEEVKDLGISDEDTFSINSRGQADYLAAQYNKLQHEVDDVNDTAKTMISKYVEKVEAWKKAELKKRESPMEWMATRLRTYAELQLKDSKKKSISLPSGTLKFNKRVEMVYDDETLLKVIEALAPEFLKKAPPTVNKAELKKHCTEKDGAYYFGTQKIDGISSITHPDTFRIV